MASTPHSNADRVAIFGVRLAVPLAVVIAVLATVLAITNTTSAQSVSVAEIVQRDRLIAEQEALLNVYRCRFDIDTHLSPGGCVGGAPGFPPKNPNRLPERRQPKSSPGATGW